MKTEAYTPPQVELLEFSNTDIITTSDGSGGTTLPELPLSL